MGFDMPAIQRNEYAHQLGAYFDSQNLVWLAYVQTSRPSNLMEIYSTSVAYAYSEVLLDTTYGNPGSSALLLPPDQMRRIKLRTLGLFKASAELYDVVFVSSLGAATAAIHRAMAKVAEQRKRRLWLGYYQGSYPAIAPLTESSLQVTCFGDERKVDDWIQRGKFEHRIGLLVYPSQLDTSGKRLPIEWCDRIREQSRESVATLVDGSAMCSNGGLDFSYYYATPDFVTVEFDRIFGCLKFGVLFMRRGSFYHAQDFQDPCLPIYKLLALDCAITALYRSYGQDPMSRISTYTTGLIKILFDRLSILKHTNGLALCMFYDRHMGSVGNPLTHGATILFSIVAADGFLIEPIGIIRAARSRQIYLGSARVGRVTQKRKALYEKIPKIFSARTSLEKTESTPVLRVSLGPTSTISDLDELLDFFTQKYAVREMEGNCLEITSPSEISTPPTVAEAAQLADRYRQRGQWAIARQLDGHVLDRRRMILGENHPLTMQSAGMFSFSTEMCNSAFDVAKVI